MLENKSLEQVNNAINVDVEEVKVVPRSEPATKAKKIRKKPIINMSQFKRTSIIPKEET